MNLRNIVNDDGRVNLGLEDQGQWGVTVSPYDMDFDTQVEECVRPLIHCFLDRGYYPVLSCDGHNLIDNPFITLAFDRESTVENFIQWAKQYRHWIYVSKDYDGRVNNCYDDTSELAAFNRMFMRSFTEIHFATVEIRSEVWLCIPNIQVIKRWYSRWILKHMKRLLPTYEHFA